MTPELSAFVPIRPGEGTPGKRLLDNCLTINETRTHLPKVCGFVDCRAVARRNEVKYNIFVIGRQL
jgi:hypothetical protein